ncbi:MAG: type II toxin-antitoxin system Phd/YefM family antitoxin [bacterium]|nr:type II toxin-antitoxin system Phd/YefM family antitoxin [bacterium]
MPKTYKAIINNEHLKWLEEKPVSLAKNKKVFAYVIIPDEEENIKNKNQESLVEFFQNSPLCNSNLDLERDKDFGREIEL